MALAVIAAAVLGLEESWGTGWGDGESKGAVMSLLGGTEDADNG